MAFLHTLAALLALNFLSPELKEERLRNNQKIKKICTSFVPLYDLPENTTFLDITERLLGAPNTRLSCKKKLILEHRRIYLFSYLSGGFRVKGYLSLLPDAEKKDLLVFLRGGSQLFGLHNPLDRFSLFPDCNVIATTYRGGVSEGINEYGGADLQDVPALIDHIPVLEKKLSTQFSKNKRYILGGSRGGMQLVLALTRFSELQSYFDKGVILSGLLDIRESIRLREELGDMFKRYYALEDDPHWLEKRNPIEHVDKIQNSFPMLIIVGGRDIYTPDFTGVDFYKKLKRLGKDAHLLEYPEGEHCLRNLPGASKDIHNWLKS